MVQESISEMSKEAFDGEILDLFYGQKVSKKKKSNHYILMQCIFLLDCIFSALSFVDFVIFGENA